MLSTLMLFNVN